MEFTVQDQQLSDRRFAAVRELVHPIPPNQRFNFNIALVGKGGFIRFGGKTYRVEDVGIYDETNEAFTEKTGEVATELTLFCINDGSTAYLEYEVDDDITTFVTVRKLSFRDLRDDEGALVDEDDLDALCEDEDAIVYEGVAFFYDDDWASLYHKGAASPQRVFFYEFESDNGEFITVEEWVAADGSEDYQVFLSREIDHRTIEVLMTEGGGDG